MENCNVYICRSVKDPIWQIRSSNSPGNEYIWLLHSATHMCDMTGLGSFHHIQGLEFHVTIPDFTLHSGDVKPRMNTDNLKSLVSWIPQHTYLIGGLTQKIPTTTAVTCQVYLSKFPLSVVTILCINSSDFITDIPQSCSNDHLF